MSIISFSKTFLREKIPVVTIGCLKKYLTGLEKEIRAILRQMHENRTNAEKNLKRAGKNNLICKVDENLDIKKAIVNSSITSLSCTILKKPECQTILKKWDKLLFRYGTHFDDHDFISRSENSYRECKSEIYALLADTHITRAEANLIYALLDRNNEHHFFLAEYDSETAVLMNKSSPEFFYELGKVRYYFSLSAPKCDKEDLLQKAMTVTEMALSLKKDYTDAEKLKDKILSRMKVKELV